MLNKNNNNVKTHWDEAYCVGVINEFTFCSDFAGRDECKGNLLQLENACFHSTKKSTDDRSIERALKLRQSWRINAWDILFKFGGHFARSTHQLSLFVVFQFPVLGQRKTSIQRTSLTVTTKLFRLELLRDTNSASLCHISFSRSSLLVITVKNPLIPLNTR